MTGSIDPKRFRQALGAFTTGVTIVTTVDASGADVGVTANSFNSVSLDPPMVLWSIAKTSTNIDAFIAAQHFAVHVLASDQDALATRFSKRGIDRFAGLQPARGPGGVALLDGCTARFQCRMAFQYEGGDHVILVGEVLAYDHEEREPLVFKSGRFAYAVAKADDSASAEVPASPAAFAPDFLLYLVGRAYYQMFLHIQPELDRRQLRLDEYLALSLLGLRDDRSLAELDSLLSYSGARVTAETGRRLSALGLVTATAGGERIALTAAGQRTLVELLAVAEAAGEDAEKGLDHSESRLLRQFLGRIIAASDPGLPSPWQA